MAALLHPSKSSSLHLQSTKQTLEGLFCESCCGARKRKPYFEKLPPNEYKALQIALDVQDDEDEAKVEKQVFLKRFPPSLQPVMQRVWENMEHVDDRESVTWPSFVSAVAALLKRDSLTWTGLLDGVRGRAAASLSEASAEQDLDGQLMEDILCFCFWCAHPSMAKLPSPSPKSSGAADKLDFAPLIKAVVEQRPPRSEREDIRGFPETKVSWLASDVPCLPAAVHSRLASLLIDERPPRDMPAGLNSRIVDESLHFLIRGMDERLWSSGQWTPLFRDAVDGRCFHAFTRKLMEKPSGGMTVIIVRTKEGAILGAAYRRLCIEGAFIQDPSSFIFAVAPGLRVMRAERNSFNHIYVKTRDCSDAKGLGFGGKVGCHRLWIDSDFEKCYTLQDDPTFKSGCLLPGEGKVSFDAKRIEAWFVPLENNAQPSNGRMGRSLSDGTTYYDAKRPGRLLGRPTSGTQSAGLARSLPMDVVRQGSWP
eukprot:TRINITY_DN13098_c0_g1_i1.p1 TRINITY_DN13098_c0_g1~~TRINITY_DN13098_c0_g1_i1.p1  ORF type:complete len:516 (+),score=96.74 TRINITY_DN13098_c0_g1_i1:111-1550(+)